MFPGGLDEPTQLWRVDNAPPTPLHPTASLFRQMEEGFPHTQIKCPCSVMYPHEAEFQLWRLHEECELDE